MRRTQAPTLTLLPAAALLVVGLSLSLPVTAAAGPPKQAQIEAVVGALDARSREGVVDAEGAVARATDAVERAKGDVAATKLQRKADRLRLSGVNTELRAVEMELKAAAANGDAAARESHVARKTRIEAERQWRRDRLRVASHRIALAQRRQARSKLALKLSESELQREKLAAWVAEGAGPGVDRALGVASTDVGRRRRALDAEDRRVARVKARLDSAWEAAESHRPKDDPAVLLTQSEERNRVLQGKLDTTSRQLSQEREAAQTLGQRLSTERKEANGGDAAAASLEEELAAARRELEAARREVTERDTLVHELRDNAVGGDPGAATELAALRAELESVREERDRAVDGATSASQDGAAGREAQLSARIQELEAQLERAEAHTAQELTEQAAASEQRLEELSAERDALAEELLAVEAGGDGAAAAQIDVLRRRMQATEEASRQRVAELEASLHARNDEVERAGARLQAATSEADSLSAEAARLGADADAKARRVAELEIELADRDAAYTEQLDELRAEGQSGSDDARVTAIQAELETVRSQLAESRHAREQAARAFSEQAQGIAQLEKRVERADEQAEQAAVELTTARTEHQAAEYELRRKLGAAVAAQKSRAADAEAAATQARSEAETLAHDLAETRMQLASVESVLAASEDSEGALAEELQARVEDLEVERDAAVEALASHRAQTDLLSEAVAAQVEVLTEAREQALDSLTEREDRIAELTASLEAAEHARRDEVTGLRAELRAAREERDRVASRVGDLELFLREARRKSARVEAENTALWTRIDEQIASAEK